MTNITVKEPIANEFSSGKTWFAVDKQTEKVVAISLGDKEAIIFDPLFNNTSWCSRQYIFERYRCLSEVKSIVFE